MKRGLLLSVFLVLVILVNSSCGGNKPPVKKPSEDVSQKTEGKITAEGVFTDAMILETADGHFTLNIPAGTKALDKKGNPIEEISMQPPSKNPSPADDMWNITVVELGPDGATFDKPVKITLSYNPGDLPDSASQNNLVMACYDDDIKEWVRLSNIIVDTNNHAVTGITQHFTIFAVQIKKPVPADEMESEAVEIQQFYLLSALSLQLDEIIGEKAWTVGYYGDGSFSSDGVAFLIEDYSRLLQERQLTQHTFIRLDGDLPSGDLRGKIIMVYGEIKDYGKNYNAFVVSPTPLVTVEDYLILDRLPDFYTSQALSNNFASISGEGEEIQSLQVVYDSSYSNFMHVLPSEIGEDSSWNEGKMAGAPATQASDCDRVLVITGGIDENNNNPRYKYNTQERFKKLKSLGFNDGQIDILQYDGSAINVNGTNVVDGSATLANIKAAIQKYLDEMPASCTLLVFVDDHGTGYSTGDAWNGEFPAVNTGIETGMTYAETSISVNLTPYIYRDTTSFGSSSGDRWILVRHVVSNSTDLWRKDGASWVFAGRDTDGDGWITEDEVNTGRINGNATANETNIGFNLSQLEGRYQASRGTDHTWDTDHDGTPDIRARWVDPPGRYHFERKVGNEWKKMAEDTNGDFIIDAADGGINWDLSNDGATGQVGFHEGINLFGTEVLWDYQFANMLGSISNKGVHVLVAMQQCYSGGMATNLQGKVEKVCASSAEDKVTWTSATDAATRASTNLTFMNHYGFGFFTNLTGIDIASWNKAHKGAVTLDTSKTTAGYTNDYQLWEVTDFKTSTAYERHDDGMYTIALRIPQGDNVYDFEIIMGLQQPRWKISLEEGIGFPEGLPEGMDSELIPGGIRVFSSSPFGADPLLVRMRAPDGTELTRINLTDASHNTIGYTTPGVEVIPDTNPLEANLYVDTTENSNPETCECTGSATIKVEAYDPNVPVDNVTDSDEGCKIASVKIYVNGELIQTARYQENSPDPALEASCYAAVITSKDLGPGTHTARVVVTNWYGQEIVREQEFVICEGLADVIPASETNKVTIQASASVQMQGYAPDCTATMEIAWSATAMTDSGISLRAAWLRVDGQVVSSSKPPGASAPPNGYLFDLPGVSTEGESPDTLGGVYTCPVNPGSTVTIDVVVFGSDCRYYMAAWEKYVPSCPVPYTPPPP